MSFISKLLCCGIILARDFLLLLTTEKGSVIPGSKS